MSIKTFLVPAEDGSMPIQAVKEDISKHGIGCTFAIDKVFGQVLERNKQDQVCEAVFVRDKLENPGLTAVKYYCMRLGLSSNIDTVRALALLLQAQRNERKKSRSKLKRKRSRSSEEGLDFLVTVIKVANPHSPDAFAIIRNINGKMSLSVTDFADIRESDRNKYCLPGKWRVFGTAPVMA